MVVVGEAAIGPHKHLLRHVLGVLALPEKPEYYRVDPILVSTHEFIDYLKGEFLDAVYLQQNAFDKTDEATGADRQKYVYALIEEIVDKAFEFENKDTARKFFQELSQMFVTWNSIRFDSDEFKANEKQVRDKISTTSS